MVSTKTKKKESLVEPSFFQGIGVIKGAITFDDAKTMITIGEHSYNLFPVLRKRKVFEKFVDYMLASNKKTLRLLVYPIVSHSDEKQSEIGFGIVNFDKGDKECFSELEDNEFKLCGWWQFISRCKLPCISVKRNATPATVYGLKHKKTYQQKNIVRGTHVPVFWKDPLVIPFKFNQEVNAEEQGKPMFVSIKAKFIPRINAFSFVSLLAMPQKESPKYLKLK